MLSSEVENTVPPLEDEEDVVEELAVSSTDESSGRKTMLLFETSEEHVESDRASRGGERGGEVKSVREDTRVESRRSREELVELYVLAFELPSGSLSKLLTEYESEELLIKCRSIFDKNLYREFERVRMQFYRDVRKVFHTSELGWIAVSREAYDLVKKYSELVRDVLIDIANTYIPKLVKHVKDEKLREGYESLRRKLLEKAERKYVKIIKVYLEPEDAIEILRKVVSDIRRDIHELEKKLKEAEEKKERKKVYDYKHEIKILERKLKMFEDFLRQLES